MKSAILPLLLACLPGVASAAEAVTIVMPEQAVLKPVPDLPGVTAAFVAGDPAHGAYALRARIAAGAKLPPHTHPDTRTTTVLSGTYYFAEGETFDASKLRALVPGTLLIVPAGTAHYSSARDGEVLIQETGNGPTATTPVRH
jgi:quercetin dioxygenase-like cupin family protein